MNRKKIRNVYKKNLQHIAAHYDRLLKDFDSDHNHNFRVEVKKLRAFIRLINTSQYGYHSRITKKIRKFYHLVGNIRNLQLHEQRIKNLSDDLLIENPQLYLDGIHGEEKSLEKKAAHMDTLTFRDFEKKLSNDAPEGLTKKNKNQFLQNSMSGLIQLLALPVYYDETFHDIRKVIKDIMYNYDYLGDQINSFMPSPLSDKMFLENLANALGNFHDLSLALAFLDTDHTTPGGEANEAIRLAELKSYLQLRKEHVKNELLLLLVPVKNSINRNVNPE